MYRKVVFSKEPTALKLESLDDAVFIQMKHKSQTFAIGGTRDHFGVYPANPDDSSSTLHRAYFKVAPVPSAPSASRLSTDQICADEIQTQRIHLGSHGTLYAPHQLHFQVAAENGVFQFGAKENWLTVSSNGVTLQGDLHCRRIYTDSPSAATLVPPTPPIPLDADGKIPREYLPEVYTTSVLHPMAGAGVGIGTTVPHQKLHVEGSAYLRDRLGIGILQPFAMLHVCPGAATPGLRIETSAGAPASLEIFARGAEKAAIALSPTNAVFEPSVRMSSLDLNTLVIDEKFYTEDHRIRLTTPLVVQAPLTIQSSIATEDASPLHLIAPQVSCEAFVAPEWLIPLREAGGASTTGFKGTYLSMTEKKIDIDERAWREAFVAGDEVALLTMPDATHLSLRRMVAVLWDTVQKLSERVKELEENQRIK